VERVEDVPALLLLFPVFHFERIYTVRKVILFNLITLDGFFEGPEHDINWHHVDQEFNDFAIEQIRKAGALIFGRATYMMMASYWPSPEAIRDDPQVAQRMNAIQKYVFSHSLDRAEWTNTHLVSGDASVELEKLKQQPGGDLFIFGSADLATTFIHRGLIDEYRLLVNPVILGKGTPMFQEIDLPINLRLIESRTFRNGNVLLIYRPEE
jgi:dihydrofolate reductase